MSVHEWFVVGQYGTRDTDGVVVPRPDFLTHAKRMGTPFTACGVRCGSWLKWFELPFPLASAPACPLCVRICGGARRDGTRDLDCSVSSDLDNTGRGT